MTYTIACNCQGFFSRRPAVPSFGTLLRRIARGSLAVAFLLVGSAVVVSSWMPTGVQPVAQQTELYLQDADAENRPRQNLSDSISASTVIGSSIR